MPKDLVQPNIPVAPDCDNSKMRKEAAKALEEMAKEAKNLGYELAINSAYRSYADQKKTYDDYFKKYDAITAASLVALPGASEHQTGLSVDLTSTSVIQKKAKGDVAVLVIVKKENGLKRMLIVLVLSYVSHLINQILLGLEMNHGI